MPNGQCLQLVRLRSLSAGFFLLESPRLPKRELLSSFVGSLSQAAAALHQLIALAHAPTLRMSLHLSDCATQLYKTCDQTMDSIGMNLNPSGLPNAAEGTLLEADGGKHQDLTALEC